MARVSVATPASRVLRGTGGSRFRPARLLAALGVPFLVVLGVGLPVLLLVINSFNTSRPGRAATYGLENWIAAFSEPGILAALWNSVTLGATRTLISLPIAMGLTWLITRSDLPGRGWLEGLCWLGIFVPALPLTLGWILLLDGRFGVVNVWWRGLGLTSGPLFDVNSFWGIVWVHLASSTIYYKVILLAPAFRRMGAAMEEAGRMAGANQFTTVRRITIPVLAPAVLAVLVLSFLRSLEAFEVEMLLGRPVGIFVYSTKIYDFVREDPPQFGSATALGSVFLVLLLALAVVYQSYLRGRQYTTVTGSGYSTRPASLGRWRYVISGTCFLIFAGSMAAPLAFLVLGSFMRRYGFFGIPNAYTATHWQEVLKDPVFLSSALNSLVIATATAFLVVLLYSGIAYFIVRGGQVTGRFVDLLVWLPWALPGILMGLGLLWLFLSTPLRAVLYGTLGGIVVALVIKDSPLSTQLFKAAYAQIAREMEESARICGASWLRTYWRVYLPLLAPTAITVWLLSFVSAFRDISVPVLLYSNSSRPVSILLLEYSFTGALERGAAIGVMMTLFIIPIMVVARWWSGRVTRES